MVEARAFVATFVFSHSLGRHQTLPVGAHWAVYATSLRTWCCSVGVGRRPRRQPAIHPTRAGGKYSAALSFVVVRYPLAVRQEKSRRRWCGMAIRVVEPPGGPGKGLETAYSICKGDVRAGFPRRVHDVRCDRGPALRRRASTLSASPQLMGRRNQ